MREREALLLAEVPVGEPLRLLACPALVRLLPFFGEGALLRARTTLQWQARGDPLLRVALEVFAQGLIGVERPCVTFWVSRN